MSTTPDILDTERLMTTDEVAKRCHVSRWTIDKLAVNKQIPFIQMGRIRRYNPHAIDEWLKDRTIEARI